MPDWTPELRRRLALLRLSPAREASIVDELSQHLDDQRQALIASGVDPEIATARTLAELERAELLAPRLGALRQARWQAAPVPGLPARPLSGLGQDLRYAFRALRREPLMTAIAVLTLTLGIGLNTSMFGFMNALMFRPLPFAEPSALVRLSRTTPEDGAGGFSPADVMTMLQAEPAFGRFAAYRPTNLALTDPGRAADWMTISPSLFDVLGVQPLLGRAFRFDDALPGRDRIVLISTALWQDQFGGAADVVGRRLETNDGSYEIVGVLPPAASDHRLFGRVGVFSPLRFDESARLDRASHTVAVIGRRGPGVSPGQAEVIVAAMGARMAADFPTTEARVGWRTEGLPESNTGPTGRILLAMLLGLSGCVLLIACSNLANLLLARAIDRSREFAVRTALGASRLQLIRTIALESLFLAGAGGVGAVLVATWTTRWLQSVVVDGGGPAVPMDWRVLAFAAAVSLATVLLCALAPALFTGRIRPNDSLKSGGRGATAAPGHVRVRNVFLIGQFALALLLVAGASFFLRGTVQMLTQSYGWSAEQVVQAEFELPVERYGTDADVLAFHQRVLARVQRIPGVASASLSYGLPYMGLRGTNQYVGEVAGSGSTLTVNINGVTPAYFDVTRTRLSAGRAFADTDTATSPAVAIISESMARRLFPDGRALGGRVAAAGTEPRVWMEIVGVVADVRPIDLAKEPAPFQLYQPTTQDPRRGLMLAVRLGNGTPAAAIAAIRATMSELDGALVVRRIATATDRMREVTASMSIVARLLASFALLGLLLAGLGIYGAMARMVAQRTSEIGLRMALGAPARHVRGLIVRSGGRLVAIGISIGLVGAFALSRLLGSVLPGMETDTRVVGAAAIGILAGVAVLACYLPARRATRVSPIVALRSE